MVTPSKYILLAFFTACLYFISFMQTRPEIAFMDVLAITRCRQIVYKWILFFFVALMLIIDVYTPSL